MKKLLLSLLLIPTINLAIAQSKWDKHSTTALEDDCIAYLSKTFKNLDEGQKETISICFSKEIKAKYTSKEEYDNLSDRELARIKSTYILQCAKTALGMELKAPEVKVEEKPNKTNLTGHWEDDESDFFLNPDGSVTITFHDDNSHEKGNWSIIGDILSLHIPRKLLGAKDKEYQIFNFQKDQFLYQSQKTMKNQTVKKIN